METKTSKFKVRLGMFVAGGFLLLIVGIFLIGKQKNLFNPVFDLTTKFHSVSGLQVGNKIRFSGIDIGTVDDIRIINDSTVQVGMIIKKDVQQFIKTDCEATIGSEGIIGDRVLIISQGSNEAKPVKNKQFISSVEPSEMDAIMASIQVTALNAEIITDQLAEIMIKVNSGKGTLGRLIQDTAIAANLSATMINIKSSSKGLDENMKAASHNFLLKGYFKDKAEKEEQLKKDKLKMEKAAAKQAAKDAKAEEKKREKEEKEKK